MFIETMKFITAICISILAFAAISQAQVCQPAPVGLVSWWSADGNALDSRSRNNGALQNGATFAAGQVGQTFDLNGTNDVVAADSPSLNFGAGSFSVETWVRADSFPTDYAAVVAKGIPPGTNRWILFRGPMGGFPWRVTLDSGGTTINAVSDATAQTGQWTHLAFVVDRTSATLKFYVNGVLQTSQPSIAGLGSLDSTLPLRIGNDNEGSFFDGQIDETSIYNRSLSQAEIQAIFNAGTAGKCKPTATVSPSGQVGWWAGDGNANDISGNGNNGSMTMENYAIGKVGQTFSLSGANAVLVPDAPGLRLSGSFTIETWIKPNSTLSGQPAFARLIDKLTLDSPTRTGYTFFTTGSHTALQGRICLEFWDTTGTQKGICTTQPDLAPPTQFTHVAGVYNQNSGVLQIYVNGILENSNTVGNLSVSTNTIPLRIGTAPGELSGFNGLIDEASIYNRALTQEEITSIVNAGIAGKLKETTSTGTTAAVGDVTVTYPSSAARRTQEILLEETDLPGLPAGMTSTGLFYDITSSAIPMGTTDLCFNLQAFAGLTNAEFNERRILHLEGTNWTTNQTISWNFATKTICARVPSLSPFAIVDSNLPPTAARVSIGGRVRRANGKGIALARVSLIAPSGETRSTFSDLFGKYRFDDVPAGATYIISVSHRHIQFLQSSQVRFIGEDDFGIEFVAIE